MYTYLLYKDKREKSWFIETTALFVEKSKFTAFSLI